MGAPRRGRPRISPGEISVPVCVRLPARVYDELYAEAERAMTTVPELLRRRAERRDIKNRQVADSPAP